MTSTSAHANQSPVPAQSLRDRYPPGTSVPAVDGAGMREMLQGAYAWLAKNHESVNALNVFPVPDGDTGTNMLLTLQSSIEEMANTPSDHLGKVMHAVAHGALMGARGNSGVILSQILRGMARSLETANACDVRQLARALRLASDTAYKGVVKPVEGTILTVVRLCADAAENAAHLDDDLRFFLRRLVHAADDAVQKTPSMLPVLAQAGVVDAGGKGLYFVLDGMSRALHGEQIGDSDVASGTFAGHAEALDGEYGFDIQFIIQGSDLDVEDVRRTITAMGDSVLVVGDERTVKVHLHSPEPGHALNYGARVGRLSRIIVENMDAQYAEFVHGEGPGDGPAAGHGSELPGAAPLAHIATVAVVSGSGLQQVFASLGCAQIVTGGQTMNPSTQELLAAIEAAPTPDVIVLPNNSNILLAAQQAQTLSKKQVRIVPSKTIPQGISALIAFNPLADLETNVKTMTAGLRHTQTGEVTIAVRAAAFDGIQVAVGDVIGLLNDELTARGGDADSVVRTLLQQMHIEEHEIITIYYGQPVDAAAADDMVASLRTDYPNQEFELVAGGQPHYHYILSAE